MKNFPYFYGNENLDQDESFMIFFLNPIKNKENRALKLAQAAPLSLIGNTELAEVSNLSFIANTDKLNLGTNEFSYAFCDQISKICGDFIVIPETKTIILDYNGFCKLAVESDMMIDTISFNLAISKESAMKRATNFFMDKNVVVQASGVQGALYTVGSYLQSAGSTSLIIKNIGLAKMTGISSLELIKSQPILAVAIPTTVAIGLYGCAFFAGDSVVGKIIVTTADILFIPMKGIELAWNCYANPLIQNIFGIPIILNMTKALRTGPGYSPEEIARYIPLDRKSILKNIKKKIVGWLSDNSSSVV